VNARLRQFQALVARLSPREQRLVAFFGVLLVASAVWSMLLGPFLTGRGRLESEIGSLRTEILVLEELAQRIRASESDAPKRSATKAAAADFSLLAFVEQAAGASLRPESIASMSPSRRPLDGGRQESTVELKLSGVALGEVVALLLAVERGEAPVYVKQFNLKKRYDDPSQFDVVLVAAAALPA
jgi:hypothetical protein